MVTVWRSSRSSVPWLCLWASGPSFKWPATLVQWRDPFSTRYFRGAQPGLGRRSHLRLDPGGLVVSGCAAGSVLACRHSGATRPSAIDLRLSLRPGRLSRNPVSTKSGEDQLRVATALGIGCVYRTRDFKLTLTRIPYYLPTSVPVLSKGFTYAPCVK